MLTIAKDNNIKTAEKIIGEINAIVKSWNHYAQKAEVRKDLKKRIKENLNTL